MIKRNVFQRCDARQPTAPFVVADGSVVTVGPRMQDAPPEVFLIVIQKDGSKAVDRL